METEAKATQAVAVTVGKAVDAGVEIGRFIGKVLGTVPQDAVGVIVGDWLREVRIRNIHRLQQRTEEVLGQREDARVEPVSPTLAIPLFEAAQDESRTELQELWARLLANAMDGSRSGVRTSFIEAIKKLDALDAVVLDKIASFGGAQTVVYHDSWPEQLGVREDELFVSFDNLKRLGCISDYNNVALHNTITGDELRLYVTHFGRELMRACAL